MMEQPPKACNKNKKNSESCNTTSKKQSRKGENPIRFTSTTEKSCDVVSPNTRICENPACRAVLSIDVDFCQRCSCCICQRFDDNKDPSLWLVCESDSGKDDSCGLSCHIECAFEHKKLGVVNPGQYMHLDGSYCCYSCGKVSGILGCWKKQLALAKDARRVDVLCSRISLSYRLLDGTAKFKDLHDIITEAKTKLQGEVGPLNGDSVKMSRGIVSRLATGEDVQKLCSNAIDEANKLLTNDSTMILNDKDVTVAGDSLPVVCRFFFEDITSSSLSIVVIDIPTLMVDSIIGYKLWYCKSQEELFSNEPSTIFTREKRRISVNHLQPCTEYTFRLVSYTETGDLGHSEAKCYTKSVEVLNKDPTSADLKKNNPSRKDHPNSNMGGSCSSFKVQDIGKILHLAWAQEQGRLEGSADAERFGEVTTYDVSAEIHQKPPVSRELDLNVVSVPDLNEDLNPPLEYSRDEDNGWKLEPAAGPDDDAAFHGVEKNGLRLAKSNGSGPSDDSQAWVPNRNRDVPAVDSLAETHRKRALTVNEEIPDNDSALLNGSPVRVSTRPGTLDENFEYCVKSIRMLERQGHITQDFRLKLLTWFSLKSTEQERRVVHTFIRELKDDPNILAGQLVDAFGDLVSSKRQRV